MRDTVVQARAVLAELQVDVAKSTDVLESVERRFGVGSTELRRAEAQYAQLLTDRDAAARQVRALAPHVPQITRDEQMRPGIPLCALCSAPYWSERHI